MSKIIISISNYRHQRSLWLYLRLLFHFVVFIVNYFVIIYGLYLWLSNDPIVVKGEKWLTPATLTEWNFTFQTIFLTISLGYDVLEWLDYHKSSFGKKLRYYRDIMFSGLIVPLTVFISTFFWTIYWIDRELVFPKIYDQLVPWWFNHCVHTNILIVVAIETLLQARRYPANQKVELCITVTVSAVYAVVYYAIYFLIHRWLYGVFGIMNWWQVCVFQIVIWGYILFAYWIQFPINRIIHKENSDVKEDKTVSINTAKPTLNGSLVNYWDSKLRTSFEDNTRL